MTAEDERQFARAVIGRVIDQYAREEISAGRTPPSPEEEQSLTDGIHAALFGVGRLQPLLDDPDVENIDINGCDQVFVGYADGREERAEPVAESDDELIELVQILGAYSGLTSRPFDTANPQLDIRLPDGSPALGGDGRLRPAVAVDPAGPAVPGLARHLVDNGIAVARPGGVPVGRDRGPARTS